MLKAKLANGPPSYPEKPHHRVGTATTYPMLVASYAGIDL